jgi:hypothetical protein
MGDIGRRRFLRSVGALGPGSVVPLVGCRTAPTSSPSTAPDRTPSRRAGNALSQELDGKRIPEGLPGGRLVTPRDPTTHKPVGEPVLRVSERPVAEVGAAWATLVRQHGRTGLWPLLLTSYSGATGSGPVWPWHPGELEPDPPERADRLDADELLADRWKQFLEPEIEPNRVPSALRRWPGPQSPRRHRSRRLCRVTWDHACGIEGRS